jgi:hypothetical protein
LTPPRFRFPTVELSLVTPQLSLMFTKGPVSVVVTVPLVQSKMPALFATLLGEGRPVSANGIGQPDWMTPQRAASGHISVFGGDRRRPSPASARSG